MYDDYDVPNPRIGDSFLLGQEEPRDHSGDYPSHLANQDEDEMSTYERTPIRYGINKRAGRKTIHENHSATIQLPEGHPDFLGTVLQMVMRLHPGWMLSGYAPVVDKSPAEFWVSSISNDLNIKFPMAMVPRKELARLLDEILRRIPGAVRILRKGKVDEELYKAMNDWVSEEV